MSKLPNFLWVFLLSTTTLFAAENSAQLEEKPPQESIIPQRTLDGIYVQAVEAYPETQPNEINLGIGSYPFNAYYQGLSVALGYKHHFNTNWAWEVVNAHYYFTFDSSLTTQLAERHGVAPRSINRIEYLVTSNAVYNLLRGKFVLLQNYIRYFHFSPFLGAGVIKTKFKTSAAANLGIRFTAVMDDKFTFGMEVRDTVGVQGFSNYVSFGLVGGYHF